MTHEAYLHTENGEHSLRCTCGRWRGASPVDTAGHARHVLVTRPAYRAMARVIAAWTGTAQRVAFTHVVDGRLERLDVNDEYAAEDELLRELLAAAEPHLAAEHRDDAADRIQEAGPQNGEKPWPFTMLLREDAAQIRAEQEQALREPARLAFAELDRPSRGERQ